VGKKGTVEGGESGSKTPSKESDAEGTVKLKRRRNQAEKGKKYTLTGRERV